jgi:hypothetical protein
MINKSNIVSVEKKYGLTNQHEIYKVVFNTDKICFVPVQQENTDYQAIQEWIEDGGTVIDNGGGE